MKTHKVLIKFHWILQPFKALQMVLIGLQRITSPIKAEPLIFGNAQPSLKRGLIIVQSLV